MPKITDITPQKNNKTRVNIFIDGRFYSGLEMEAQIKSRLKVGMAIDVIELEAAVKDSERISAFSRAIGYLSKRMKTECEIRDYLAKRGYTEDIVAHCIEKLKEYGYINDVGYAENFAQARIRTGGKRKLRFELMRKGLDGQTIDNALENIDDVDELESAKQIAQKYMRNKEPSRDNKLKLYRYLAGKGFSHDIIKEAIKYDELDFFDESD